MHNKSLRYKTYSFLVILFVMIIAACTSPEKKKETEKETGGKEIYTEASEKKLEEWHKNKLSLFVYFGVYSLYQGKSDNQPVGSAAENIMATASISPEEYERKAREFDPKKWDANEIVNMARDIGMKRIVLNAKHHDGFCLFKTNTTDFNSVDFTPANTDLVKEMSDACKSGNIKFSLSYSLTDWHLPAAGPMSANHNTPVTEEHHNTNLKQIEELLTKYGSVSEIYFYSGLNTPEQSNEIRRLVKRLQPDCLISDGIGNDMGDFIATEFNTLPGTPPDIAWNMLASAFPDTRAFTDVKSGKNPVAIAKEKVREMIQVISSGGNYSLSIGPKADGSTEGEEEEILKNIGRWIKVNRNAVYETIGSPFNTQSSNFKITRKKNKLYLFMESVPATSTIRLSGLDNKITAARFLGSGISLQFVNKGSVNEILWTSPAMADPMELPVIEVEFENTIRPLPRKSINVTSADTLILGRKEAIHHNSITQQDRVTAIPSTIALTWHINASHQQKADFKYLKTQKDREIEAITAQGSQNFILKGKQGHLICSKYDTIQTGDIYRSDIFYGDLKEVHVNPNGSNRLRILKTSWHNLRNIKDTHLIPLPMSTRYYYVEIESENEQQYCYRITGNDGLQIWFNQEEILLNRNHAPGTPMTRELVFDLKKGKNILLIKNYNRVGSKDYFDLLSLPDAHWWRQTISIPANPKYLKIKSAGQQNPFQDIGLGHLTITLTPEK
ncbi:alpha-L-fucosidase [Marinilabilia salmonicolor]|uniref:alpha-L-fucosidase n=1 Tax=Marinilabilia salmonicolor TaxID=989 RepID=UPI00029A1142|nr:alpha-L-fucosidase [Marinilabilia salmonicolor]